MTFFSIFSTVSVDSSNAKLKTNKSNSDLTDGKSADIKSENLKNGDIKNENTDKKIDNKVTLNGDSDTNSHIKCESTCESTCETDNVKESKEKQEEKQEGSTAETENESAEKDCDVKTEPTCLDNDRDIKNEAKPEDLCENGTNGSETVKDTEVEELSQNDDEDAKRKICMYIFTDSFVSKPRNSILLNIQESKKICKSIEINS